MLVGMHQTHLAQVDLNLVPALAALLEERSVSRAADVVGLSQSAMSRALQRLRRILDDELLIRGRDGYRLTSAAEQIQSQLAGAVAQLSEVFLERDQFDPARETRRFRLSGSDYASVTIAAPLFHEVSRAAPQASVRFFPWHGQVMDDLAEGKLDLVFSGMHVGGPLESQLIFQDTMVCVVSRNHPWSDRESLDLKTYLAGKHLVVDIENGLQPSVDGVLAARGQARNAAFTVPFHTAATSALIGTDLALTMPGRVIRDFVTLHGEELRILGCPEEISALPYYMSWHVRSRHDKGHQWLREKVVSAVRTGEPRV